MKKLSKSLLLFVWVMAGTLMVSRWWYANPEYFPFSSEQFWRSADRLFHATSIDEAADVEFFVTVATAFLSTLIATSILMLTWKVLARKPRHL